MKTLSILFLSLSLLFGQSMKIHTVNGVDDYLISEIDSITFSISSNLMDGLVAYYPFNGNANDESMNGNDGTVISAVLTSDRFGVENSAYNFDGSGDYINCGADSILEIGGQGTISLWIYPYDKTRGDIIGKDDSGCNDDIAIGINSHEYAPDSINFVFNLSNNELPDISCDFNINEWIHIVGTWDENGMKLYKNNQLVSSNTVACQMIDRGNPLLIGRAAYPTTAYFNGKIDDIFLYSRVLSKSEIDQLYNRSY